MCRCHLLLQIELYAQLDSVVVSGAELNRPLPMSHQPGVFFEKLCQCFVPLTFRLLVLPVSASISSQLALKQLNWSYHLLHTFPLDILNCVTTGTEINREAVSWDMISYSHDCDLLHWCKDMYMKSMSRSVSNQRPMFPYGPYRY